MLFGFFNNERKAFKSYDREKVIGPKFLKEIRRYAYLQYFEKLSFEDYIRRIRLKQISKVGLLVTFYNSVIFFTGIVSSSSSRQQILKSS